MKLELASSSRLDAELPMALVLLLGADPRVEGSVLR